MNGGEKREGGVSACEKFFGLKKKLAYVSRLVKNFWLNKNFRLKFFGLFKIFWLEKKILPQFFLLVKNLLA